MKKAFAFFGAIALLCVSPAFAGTGVLAGSKPTPLPPISRKGIASIRWQMGQVRQALAVAQEGGQVVFLTSALGYVAPNPTENRVDGEVYAHELGRDGRSVTVWVISKGGPAVYKFTVDKGRGVVTKAGPQFKNKQ
jgi:hypothetical protein